MHLKNQEARRKYPVNHNPEIGASHLAHRAIWALGCR